MSQDDKFMPNPSHHECIFVIVLLLSLVTGQTRLGYILEIPKKKNAQKKFRPASFQAGS